METEPNNSFTDADDLGVLTSGQTSGQPNANSIFNVEGNLSLNDTTVDALDNFTFAPQELTSYGLDLVSSGSSRPEDDEVHIFQINALNFPDGIGATGSSDQVPLVFIETGASVPVSALGPSIDFYEGIMDFIVLNGETVRSSQSPAIGIADPADNDDRVILSVSGLTYTYSEQAASGPFGDQSFGIFEPISRGLDLDYILTINAQGGAAAPEPTGGDDDLTFGNGNDTIEALSGDDTIDAGGGNDVIDGGAGDDRIEGGSGVDRAVYSADQSRFTVQINIDGTVVIADRDQGGDGTDILSGIETLGFGGGGTFNLDKQVGIVSLDSAEIDSLVELYIAYFNRAPDAEGLNFWGTAYADGFTLGQIAELILGDDETNQTYPDTLSSLDFATQVYNNVLGRSPDQEGLGFWVNALESGGVTRDQFILQVLLGVRSDPPETATPEEIALRAGDVTYLEQKTDIGLQYASNRGMSDTDTASAVMNLFERDNDDSVSDALTAIDQAYTAALGTDEGDFLIQLVGVADDPF